MLGGIMSKRMITALVLLLVVLPLSARIITYNDNWGRQGYNLISSTRNGVEIIFSVDLWRLVKTEIDGKTMFTVTVPGSFLPNRIGAPDLPSLGRFIAIPQGARARVTILDKRIEVIKDVEVAPAPPLPLDSDPSEPKAPKDPA
ncbi:MAG TPA: hypothetical protein EYP24_06030, partial [bacterium (Candidatus Stahlbacteria)]|nr:hypothetical protein [Candidatus Stahlbacteria bacterium]